VTGYPPTGRYAKRRSPHRYRMPPSAHHGVVTGELHAVKAERVVREEGAGQGPASRRHLASVLPHSGTDL
jgi:hypothetical protein